MNKIRLKLFIIALILCTFARIAPAQTSAFTYQGRLTDSSAQANATYDLGFALYDAETGGTQIGAALTRSNVSVSGGIFTVQLDFGATAFPGANRFLQIAVKKTTETNFTTLTPRQPVTSTPYAIRAISAATADTATNASQLGGATANQFVLTGDTRLSDSRTPTAGSANYIQNQNTAAQSSTDFSIDGIGAANFFNAATSYSIGGRDVLRIPGSNNLFVGVEAGALNTTGSFNSFFGRRAGVSNATGSNNTAVGQNANVGSGALTYATAIGSGALVSDSNSVVLGRAADTVRIPGNLIVTGTTVGGTLSGTAVNSSGQYNIGGSRILSSAGTNNLFAGIGAGTSNTQGSANSFFGRSAGFDNTTGAGNSFVGVDAGRFGTTGNFNSFFGVQAGQTNTTGGYNTAVGHNADVAANNLVFASAIGSQARVAANDTIVIGKVAGNYTVGGVTAARPADAVQIPGTLSANVVNTTSAYAIGGSRVLATIGTDNLFLGFGAGNANTGTDNTFLGYHAGLSSSSGSYNSFVGVDSGYFNRTGSHNSIFGYRAGYEHSDGNYNSYFGVQAGEYSEGSNNTFFGANTGGFNTSGSNNTLLGQGANVATGNLNYATAIGSGATVGASNTIVLGRQNRSDTILVPGAINFSTSDNNNKISYDLGTNGLAFSAGDIFSWFNVRNNRVNMQLDSSGTLRIVGSYNQFSDARYKTDVRTFAGALDTVRRLRGVTFNWKPELNKDAGNQIGFIAQEVEGVLPELVSTDKEGYKSVAYSNAVPVLVEAVKEQQAQIEAKQNQLDALREQVKRQQTMIDDLRKLVCAGNSQAEICRENE